MNDSQPTEVQASNPSSVNAKVEEETTGSSNGNQNPNDSSVSGSPPQPAGTTAQRGSVNIPAKQTTSESVTEEITEDVLPAHVGDLPAPKDALGFTPYVDAIASFLTNKATKPPLTLSIEGEWGSGKSSFMMQLKEQLKNKMSVVDFNAWRYDKDEAMWAAFALEFARKLRTETPWYVRPWAHVKFFFRRFDWERSWVEIPRLVLMIIAVLFILLLPLVIMWLSDSWPTSIAAVGAWFATTTAKIIGAGGILGYLTLVALLAYKLKDVVGGTFKVNLKQYLDAPDYKSRVAFIDEFHEDFKKVTEIYGRKKKVCVFIDDLDRCEVPKAADLMQSLNLMISTDRESQLIFIMGMDREKVAAGLAVKHEKLLPYLAPALTSNGSQSSRAFDPVQGLEYGYGFIEKFIQLPFRIPQAGETEVRKFLKDLVGAADAEPPAEKTTDDKATVEGRRAEDAVTTDLKLLEEIVGMVAPTLDYNPRRLKQFINAFRLKTFIASKLNLFGEPADTTKYNKLTVQQIGKFVAISLRWPLLLADLDKERDLLSRLQTVVLGEILPEALSTRDKSGQIVLEKTISVAKRLEPLTITEPLARWYGRENLRTLLEVKLFKDGSRVDDGTEEKYSLEKLNVDKLLQVSPVIKPTKPTSHNTGDGEPD